MEPRTLSLLERGLTFVSVATAVVLGSLALLACGPALASRPAAAGPMRAPERLSETGLWADASATAFAPGVRPFEVQYPLWTDGAAKRRWVYLPDGATIDARDPYAWSFPVGTKLWKEFRFERRVETRYMEHVADGTWVYASYVWPADGGEAVRGPDGGVRGATATGLGTRHDIPSVQDCRACHEASPGRVLGFGALQLAGERDPLAPHAALPEPDALGLDELLASGRLEGSAQAIRAAARPIDARTPRERAVLGYLHGNCGGCHNASGPLASLGLELEYRHDALAPALRTALSQPSRYLPDGARDAKRIVPGDAEASVLYRRAASRFGALQMPPLGTHAVDAEALALLREWIELDLAPALTVAAEIR
jgi:hypothetical protein